MWQEILSKINKFIRNYASYIRLLVWAFAALVLITIILSLCLLAGGANNRWFAAFMVAWYEDFFFFLIAGVATALAGVLKLENDRLENRYKALLNSDEAKKRGLVDDHLDEIKKIGAFSSRADLLIRVVSYIKEYNAFEFQITMRQLVHNGYKDSSYRDPNFSFGVYTNTILPPDEPFAEVGHIRLTFLNTRPSDEAFKLIVPEREILTGDRRRWDLSFEFEIDKNGSVLYEYEYMVIIGADDGKFFGEPGKQIFELGTYMKFLTLDVRTRVYNDVDDVDVEYRDATGYDLSTQEDKEDPTWQPLPRDGDGVGLTVRQLVGRERQQVLFRLASNFAD